MNIEISRLAMTGGDTERTRDTSKAYGGHKINKYWPSLFKLFELILSVICIGLIDDPANNVRIRSFIAERTVGLSYATFGAFIIFTTLYLLGKVIGDTWPWKTSAILSLVATMMFVACAATILTDYSRTKSRNYWPPNAQRLELVCAAGSVSVATAVLFLVDFVLTVKQGYKGYLD